MIRAMTQKDELQLRMNERMDAQQLRMDEMQVEDGTMIQAMTQKMDELQLTMNERMEAQNLRSPNSEDGAADVFCC